MLPSLAPRMGLEPIISALKGQRPNQIDQRGIVKNQTLRISRSVHI